MRRRAAATAAPMIDELVPFMSAQPVAFYYVPGDDTVGDPLDPCAVSGNLSLQRRRSLLAAYGGLRCLFRDRVAVGGSHEDEYWQRVLRSKDAEEDGVPQLASDEAYGCDWREWNAQRDAQHSGMGGAESMGAVTDTPCDDAACSDRSVEVASVGDVIALGGLPPRVASRLLVSCAVS